ncbi:hypothetical protein [Propylenella binzhouense]|uniref:Uncharacterized protein n=1 Tax=Propylenella binzhouense TaxID=2555902 RepID=A0A964WSS9_9HYPH|nr:hypothetical protein [Propylenella binzhouense]MYZ47287.1 hypothetical protein [Propylenella binzhouense]
MNRQKMLIGVATDEARNVEQKRVYHEISAGPRGEVPRPFLAMLDIPDITRSIQVIGAQLRFLDNLPADLREIAIPATAAALWIGI